MQLISILTLSLSLASISSARVAKPCTLSLPEWRNLRTHTHNHGHNQLHNDLAAAAAAAAFSPDEPTQDVRRIIPERFPLHNDPMLPHHRLPMPPNSTLTVSATTTTAAAAAGESNSGSNIHNDGFGAADSAMATVQVVDVNTGVVTATNTAMNPPPSIRAISNTDIHSPADDLHLPTNLPFPGPHAPLTHSDLTNTTHHLLYLTEHVDCVKTRRGWAYPNRDRDVGRDVHVDGHALGVEGRDKEGTMDGDVDGGGKELEECHAHMWCRHDEECCGGKCNLNTDFPYCLNF